MTTMQVAAILIAVGLIVVVLLLILRQRTDKLRARFGPEYD